MSDADRDRAAHSHGKPARDIFVISDLHLGDGGARDNFEPGGRTRQLHQFLDHVGAEGGEIVILGDLFELWQMNLSRILVHRLPVLEHFAQLPLAYVPGNHDVDLLHFVGSELLAHPFFARMRPPFDRRLGGRRFHFFHGHETDPFNNSDDPGFGQMLSIFAGLFEDRNGSPLLASGETMETVLEQFGESMMTLWTAASLGVSARAGLEGDIEPRHSLTPTQNRDRLTEHIESVRAARDRQGWDVGVLGHTHKAGRIENWYHNSGSWVGARNSFLRIDPEGHVRYLEWKDGRPIELEAPLVQPGGEGEKNPLRKATASVRLLFPRPTTPGRSRIILIGQGALALGLGLWAFSLSIAYGRTAALSFLVFAFGSYVLVDGALSLLGASHQQSVRRLIDRLRGSLSILLGLVFLIRSESLEIFVVLVGLWALVTGGLRTATAALLRKMVEARWLWIVGVGSMLAGVLLLLLPPSAPFLAYVLAGYLCIYGAGELLAGIFGRRRSSRPWRIRSMRPRTLARQS
jgi:UDP-2,3-diacylglucosamine pyrophosphatase LpxH/uncharacterized membrane protein HdeD (DUF308 family)